MIAESASVEPQTTEPKEGAPARPTAANKGELNESSQLHKLANLEPTPSTEPALPGNFSCPPVEVIFGPSSTSIGSAAQATLEPLAHWIAAHANADEVVVEGHADRRGSEDANLWVSHERARVVAATLAKYGVDEERLVQRGIATKPPFGSESSDAQQRRVVISVKNSSGECPPLVVAAGGTL
jgi:outer membrane protein OmpA-like peptidoglycan-associated protein